MTRMSSGRRRCVLGSKALLQLRRVLGAHGRVELALLVSQPRVALAVDQIVQVLGQVEECGVLAAHHDPLRVQAELVQDRDQLGHHLGHAAAT
jgi:hypothetical protein